MAYPQDVGLASASAAPTMSWSDAQDVRLGTAGSLWQDPVCLCYPQPPGRELPSIRV